MNQHIQLRTHAQPSTQPQLPSGARQQRLGSRAALASSLVAATLAIAACGGGGSGGGSGGLTADGAPIGNFAVAQNGGGEIGVLFFTPDLATLDRSLATGANEGIVFSSDGTLYQNSDGDFTGLRAFNLAADRPDNDVFSSISDRVVNTVGGKGLVLIEPTNALLSFDNMTDIEVYASTAGPDAAPTATLTTTAALWDGFFDEDADRLYVAQTDGTLAIYDGATAATGATTPSRVVTPVDAQGDPVSVNFHGVFVEGNTILVSDVGDAASAADGALFVFTETGTLDGNITDFQQISGPSTVLGNPVDAILSGGHAIVAEKSNDALLVFHNVATRSGDITPDFQQAVTKPESIAFVRSASNANLTDVSDIDRPTAIRELAVALNPTPVQQSGLTAPDNSDVGVISLVDSGLDGNDQFSASEVSGIATMQSFRTLENVQFDVGGNAYATFDITDGSAVSDRGILVIHNLDARGGEQDDPNRERVISGANTGLVSPKGIELAQSRGAMIVADVGSSALHVFSLNAVGDAPPLFTVTDTGSAAIWDVDYDPIGDRLFAAGTAGDVLIYDNFFASAASATVTRSFALDNALDATNLHGIVYVASTDQLIISDVADPAGMLDGAVNNDGSIYVVDAAASASGLIEPRTTIRGEPTLLANPVDLAFDGQDLYVAEKVNNKVLKYNNILGLLGDIDDAADLSSDQNKPEAVTLLPVR